MILGIEGGSDNHRLLYAWNDWLWAVKKNQGSFPSVFLLICVVDFFSCFAFIYSCKNVIKCINKLIFFNFVNRVHRLLEKFLLWLCHQKIFWLELTGTFTFQLVNLCNFGKRVVDQYLISKYKPHDYAKLIDDNTRKPIIGCIKMVKLPRFIFVNSKPFWFLHFVFNVLFGKIYAGLFTLKN